MAATAPGIVLLHGFTQTGRSWRPVLDRLGAADRAQATTPDAPGHGTADALRLDLIGAASRIADQVRAAGDGPALVVGYSMGGRTALRLALDHPDVVARLVLVGATAGIDDPAERADRRSADGALADRIERDGVGPFLERWLAQPLFASLQPEADDLAARRANTAAGLASSLRLTGTGAMDPPWWDELASIDAPTLVVWGERDAKFAALGERLVAAIGSNAHAAVIADAGHAAHLEQPAAFATLLRR